MNTSSFSFPLLRGASRALAGIAIMAALAIGLVLSTVGPLWAQDGPIEYAEDRTDPVATFTATDPEGEGHYLVSGILRQPTTDDFTIEGGVLTVR